MTSADLDRALEHSSPPHVWLAAHWTELVIAARRGLEADAAIRKAAEIDRLRSEIIDGAEKHLQQYRLKDQEIDHLRELVGKMLPMAECFEWKRDVTGKAAFCDECGREIIYGHAETCGRAAVLAQARAVAGKEPK